MTTTTLDVGSLPPLSRRDAVELGRIEYRRFVDALRTLDDGDWGRPTDCEGWTVRDLAGHLGGAMVTATSIRKLAAEQFAVKKRARSTGERDVDAMTAIQCERMARLTTAELVERMAGLVEAAADGRARVPGFVARAARFPVETGTIAEKWTMDYLLGVILTRDTWLHRVADLPRAVGHQPVLDRDHDGCIVTDVVAEWVRRHGQPVTLTLTGPAGGAYVAGTGGVDLELDAVEFCRILSGRAEPTHDLLAQQVPF